MQAAQYVSTSGNSPGQKRPGTYPKNMFRSVRFGTVSQNLCLLILQETPAGHFWIKSDEISGCYLPASALCCAVGLCPSPVQHSFALCNKTAQCMRFACGGWPLSVLWADMKVMEEAITRLPLISDRE